MELDDAFSVQRPRPASFSFGRRLAEAANVVGKVTQSVGEVITRTAASAGELLVDSELRWKGTSKFLTEAQKGVQTIQKGVGELQGKLQQGAVTAMQHGFKAGGIPVQIMQRVIKKQLAELQRHQFAMDTQPLVDIQIGPQVYEDMPQEMRSRLWYVILENSHLVGPLRPLHRPNSRLLARFSQTNLHHDSPDLITFSPSPGPAHPLPDPTHSSDNTEIELSVFTPATPDPIRPTNQPTPNSPFMTPGAAPWATPTSRAPSGPTTSKTSPLTSPKPSPSKAQHNLPSPKPSSPRSKPFPIRLPLHSSPTRSPPSTSRSNSQSPTSPRKSPSPAFRLPFRSKPQSVSPRPNPSQPAGPTTPGKDLIDLGSPNTMSPLHDALPQARTQPSTSQTPTRMSQANLINLESPDPSIQPPSIVPRYTPGCSVVPDSVTESAVLLGSPLPAAPQDDVPPLVRIGQLHNACSSDVCTVVTATPITSVPSSSSNHTDTTNTLQHATHNPLIPNTSTQWPDSAQAASCSTTIRRSSPPQDSASSADISLAGFGDVITTSCSPTTQQLSATPQSDGKGQADGACFRHPLADESSSANRTDAEQADENGEQGGLQTPQVGQQRMGRTPTELLEWEVIPNLGGRFQDGMQEGQVARSCIQRISGDGDEAARKAVSDLKEAMSFVPWPIPTTYEPDCKFATLNSITLGQEEVDEVIYRDINRTFPEHPYFGERAGQMCLFRILKAYSLHDLEVGYCQGMAFVAGILLMYLPEEPAFRLFCRLMNEDGPNMRRLYLPGLEPLKVELARLENLMARYMPDLHAHLREYGIPPVLYASQWFLTSYSCPFPHTFSARVLDIMLQDDDDKILQRLALSILNECRSKLLQLDDFEAIITCLKVTPVNWELHQLRKVINNALASQVTDKELEESLQVATEETARITREASTRHRRTASLQRLPSAVSREPSLLQSDSLTSSLASYPSVTASAVTITPGSPGTASATAAAAPVAGSEPDLIAMSDVLGDVEDMSLEEQWLNMIFPTDETRGLDEEADGGIDAGFGM